MFHASVSKIKSFNGLLQDSPWSDHDSVILDIMGVKKEKVSFDLGNCVDAYINDGLVGGDTYTKITDKLKMQLHQDGTKELDTWIQDFKLRHPVYEVQKEVNKIYHTKYGEINIAGKLDVLCPNVIKDNKTTKNSDYDNYISDIQGFLYMDILKVPRMEYEIFKVSHITNRVKYEGYVKQTPASPGYVQGVIEAFMRFVIVNNLQPFVNKPEVYMLDTVIFSQKHFYKTIASVLKDDPSYIRWMKTRGYVLSEEVISLIPKTGLKEQIGIGKHKGKTVAEVVKLDAQWLTWALKNVPGFELDDEVMELIKPI